jgi:hypothetical protein
MVRGRRFRRMMWILAAAYVSGFGLMVHAQESAGPAAPSADAPQSLQARIQDDPQVMSAVKALSDNPQVQDILGDPAIAAALSRGDLAALLANPKIKRLAEDPAVQDITRQVTK